MGGPLIVALDGSDKDGRAIAVARAIARLSGRAIHLVRVVEEPPIAALTTIPAVELRTDLAFRVSTAETALAAQADALGSTTTLAVFPGRDIAGRLIAHADDFDALLIVLGTRAAGAGGRAIIGSVADRVMRESPRPVVLVPPGAAFLAGKEPRITRVLVPLDGSPLALRSLEFIIALPQAAIIEYALVEIVNDDAERADAEARLRISAAWLRSHGIARVDEIVGVASDPAVAIVNVVREVFPDVITMSTRGAGGLGRLIFGSVAEGVLRRSELPVMVLTPRMLARSFTDGHAVSAGSAGRITSNSESDL